LTPFEFKEATNEARKEADADARVEVSSVLSFELSSPFFVVENPIEIRS